MPCPEKSNMVRFVSIVENKELNEKDKELMIVICKTVLFEMLCQEKSTMQRIPYFGLLKDLLEKI